MSDLSWLNPTPHAIAVYASRPLSPVATQHLLPSGRYPLLGPDFHRLDRTSLRLTHSFDHLVGARQERLWNRQAERLGGDAPDPLRRDNSRPSPHTRRVGALITAFHFRKQGGYCARLTGADRSFPARGPRLWPCVGSGRPDFRHGFWRCLHDGDYRSDATFSVSPSGSPSRSAPCLILGVVSGGLGFL